VSTLEGKTLKIANIGDSTTIIIRFSLDQMSSKILLRTEEQQHNFNAPYQLAKIPEGLKPLSKKGEGNKRKFWKDKVSDAVLYQTTVKEGDIIISGTDGLFDNLFTEDITNITDVFMTECLANSSSSSLNTHSNTPEYTTKQMDLFSKTNAKTLAHELVKEAWRKSRNKKLATPFANRFDSRKIKKEGQLLVWKGGKPDDICAVVAFVKKTVNTFSLRS